MTEPVAAPVGREILEREIASLHPVAEALRGGSVLYSFRAAEAPMLMREVGRLREQAFRASGGGTGRSLDIDEDDTAARGYRQMVAWDPRRGAITGGYRYTICSRCDPDSISTSHYFRFSDEFVGRYLPRAVELGRSFVVRTSPQYPLFAMDSLWQGLGAVVAEHPHVRYLFGKVTVYPSFDRRARLVLEEFLHRFFAPERPLLRALTPSDEPDGGADMRDMFRHPTYKENYAELLRRLHERGERIPPMIQAYMRLCPSMRVFDTTLNRDFGGVFETAVLLTIEGMRSDKKLRYIKKGNRVF